jgi:hypothetical protein
MSHLTLQGGGAAAVDYSANVETLPPAGWTLMKTIPAASHTARAAVEIQNRSTSPLRFIVYGATDETVRTIYTLEPASAQYRGGGSWYSLSDKGKIEIYGLAGTETFSARVS